MFINKIDYLTIDQEQRLLHLVEKNKKYKLLTLLMLDAGLRVSEAVSLKNTDILYKEQTLKVKSLKKRKDVYREVPMTGRLVEALADYLQYSKLDNEIKEKYLFTGKNGFLGRKAVWRYYNRLKFKEPRLIRLHPHALRHTFATRLISNNANLLTTKELLGHSSVKTTEIYTHIPAEVLKQSIKAIEHKTTIFQKLKRKLYPKKTVLRSPIKFNGQLIGREAEIEKIKYCLDKKINLLIKGEQGVGKSRLLEELTKENYKIAILDDLSGIKKSLIELAMFILKNKDHLKALLYGEKDPRIRLSKESIKNIVEVLKRIATKHEYSLFIDDITRITPVGVNALEQLNEHFHVIACARTVKITKSSFLTNFETLELKKLNRPDSLQLIYGLSYDVLEVIEDYELYQNHICEQTEGNPKYIIELIERYRKEGFIANEVVRKIRHNASMNEIDFTPFVIISLASLMVLRYLGREIGEGSFQLIGGAALVFAIFARTLFRTVRRKFI